MKIPLDKIIVGERQRIDLGDPLTDLQSMSDPDVGQINPISVERQLDGQYLLLAGMRRLTYAKANKWTEIEAVERTGLTEVQRQKVEFCEDIERKDRSWQEKALAVYRMFHLMRRERIGTPTLSGRYHAWTVSAMASFTGYNNTQVGYFLQIGEALAAMKDQPTDIPVHADEEMWQCESYTKAVSLLTSRVTERVHAEMERRRAIVMATQQGVLTNIQAIPRDAGILEPGGIPQQDTTPAEPNVIYLHGVRKAYEDCIPDEDFMNDAASCVLIYKACGPEWTTNLEKHLRRNGFAIWWCDTAIVQPAEGLDMLFNPLIWNLIDFDVKEPWPFANNYAHGHVLFRDDNEPEGGAKSGSVISSIPHEDPSVLPPSVVDFSIHPLTTDGMAVHCLTGVDPVHVAQLGRVPVFYDGNVESFDKTCARLKEYYEQLVPGCEVRLK